MTVTKELLLDDFSDGSGMSKLGTRWEMVSDTVMGGVSHGQLTFGKSSDSSGPDGGIMRLTGDVRLENNGGFVQAATDLAPGGGVVDLSGYCGIHLVAFGPADE